jgi:hypothetical protein
LAFALPLRMSAGSLTGLIGGSALERLEGSVAEKPIDESALMA